MKSSKAHMFLSGLFCVFSSNLLAQTSEFETLLAQSTAPSSNWVAPANGPELATGVNVVYLAGNLRNSGILGVAEGAKEGAEIAGWGFTTIDARGDEQLLRDQFVELIQAPPNGLILGGFDALQYSVELDLLAQRGTKIVGWHASSRPGAIPGTSVAFNVTTDPTEVARVATIYAIEETDREGGFIVFTDSRFAIALEKSDTIAELVEQCETCSLLEVVDLSLDSSADKMRTRIGELIATYGTEWTASVGINDLYFDHAFLEFALSDPEFSNSLVNVSAGDGSASAYQRIQHAHFQSATVPEPLNFQGWQLIDELNRLLNNLPVSGFVAPTKLVTTENILDDGGADFRFDPSNNYRQTYAQSWQP